MSVIIIIPWRDRGHDPLRPANLDRVLHHWNGFGAEVIVSPDGGTGDEQFNRSRAYNCGVAESTSDTLIFTESDMLIDYEQIRQAVELAQAAPGLVVPFSTYRYLSQQDSERVRRFEIEPAQCVPESMMENGRSIGAINVLSRASIEAVGRWDESFSGSWWDDTAMKRAFDVCCGLTRWVTGPAHHLYHLPAHRGDHLTDEDRAATARNRQRYNLYRAAHSPRRIRQLTTGQGDPLVTGGRWNPTASSSSSSS